MSGITSAVDNFVSILLKMGNSYLKKLSNMGNKKIQEKWVIFLSTHNIKRSNKNLVHE